MDEYTLPTKAECNQRLIQSLHGGDPEPELVSESEHALRAKLSARALAHANAEVLIALLLHFSACYLG